MKVFLWEKFDSVTTYVTKYKNGMQILDQQTQNSITQNKFLHDNPFVFSRLLVYFIVQ